MRKGAQELKDLDVDRAAPPAVKRSISDETVDPSGSNVNGEHDAADGVAVSAPYSRRSAAMLPLESGSEPHCTAIRRTSYRD